MLKIIIVFFVLCSGCFLWQSPPGHVGKIPDHLSKTYPEIPVVYDRHYYGDLKQYKVGQWVKYHENDVVKTIKVVKEEQNGYWVEIQEETSTTKKTSLRLTSGDGQVLKAYYKEGKGNFVKQEVVKGPSEAHVIEPTEVNTKKVDHEIRDKIEKVWLIEKIYDDEIGRQFKVKTWWSESVPPLYDVSDYGGLVEKEAKDLYVKLRDFGLEKDLIYVIPTDK